MAPNRTYAINVLFMLFIMMSTIEPVSSFSSFFSPRRSSFLAFSDHAENDHVVPGRSREALHNRRKDWIDRSVSYYSKVMREERRRNNGQLKQDEEGRQEEYIVLAKKHYFALHKIKYGKLQHAERIYRRIIDELLNEEDGECDHAKLAVTTLLLALLMQRMGDIKGTRAVFLEFFRTVVIENEDEDTECACSAKVLGAYALFEMKNGFSHKSLQIAKRATKFDPSLKPVLRWKQFRESESRNKYRGLHP